MMRTFVSVIGVGVLLSAVLLAAEASAQNERTQFAPTDGEMLALPQYCQARLRGRDGAKEAWEQRMGREQFVHVHHHCFGLNFMNRAAMEFEPKARQRHLRSAVKNFDYVLSRWPPGFQLTSEAQSMKMQAEMMLAR